MPSSAKRLTYHSLCTASTTRGWCGPRAPTQLTRRQGKNTTCPALQRYLSFLVYVLFSPFGGDVGPSSYRHVDAEILTDAQLCKDIYLSLSMYCFLHSRVMWAPSFYTIDALAWKKLPMPSSAKIFTCHSQCTASSTRGWCGLPAPTHMYITFMMYSITISIINK